MTEAYPEGELAQGAGPARLIIHAGAPKCGSSSLQAALTERPRFRDRAGREMSYLAVNPEVALTGALLQAQGAASRYGYAASADMRGAGTAEAVLGRLVPAAERVLREGAVPILSSEGWVRRAPEFRKSRALERLGGGAHVVIFVRPPLDWLNSGWWQWGLWSTAEPDRWLRRAAAHVRWGHLAKDWAAVPGVEAVHVRLADRDVVGTFFDVIGAAPPPEVGAAVNTTLPGPLTAFLARNRDLRPSAHASSLEFVLARALRDAGPPPEAPPLWILDPERLDALWAELRFHPRQLIGLLPSEDRARMQADRRWHGLEAYRDRPVSHLSAYETPEALTALHDWLAAAAGAQPARGRFSDPGEADPAIRALVARLTETPRSLLGSVRDWIRPA